MSKRFTLSGFWLSGPTYKVGLMLSLCGEGFAYHSVNLRAGEHKSPAFIAKNRFGQVPALEDAKSGMALCQSAAILEYLAAELGKFGGEGACGAAQAREWMFWDFDRLAAPIYRLRAQRAGFRTFSQPIVEMYFAEAGAALKVLEEALGKTAWLCGSQPSIADIDVYGVVAYAPQAGFDLAAYPAISAWTKRMEALPGFIGINDLPKATQA